MSTKYQAYLQTEYWQNVAKTVKVRDGYRCRLCSSQHELCVHHSTYDHRGNEMEHLIDLVTLCRSCHSQFHGKTDQGKERVPANVVPAKSYTLGSVILTEEMIENCRTARGAFTFATTRALGVPMPLKRGWVGRAVGTVIDHERYQQALAGRTIFV